MLALDLDVDVGDRRRGAHFRTQCTWATRGGSNANTTACDSSRRGSGLGLGENAMRVDVFRLPSSGCRWPRTYQVGTLARVLAFWPETELSAAAWKKTWRCGATSTSTTVISHRHLSLELTACWPLPVRAIRVRCGWLEMVEIVISISIVTVCGLRRFQVAGAGLDSDLGFGLRSGVDDGHRRPTRPRIGVRACARADVDGFVGCDE